MTISQQDIFLLKVGELFHWTSQHQNPTLLIDAELYKWD